MGRGAFSRPRADARLVPGAAWLAG
jgi:hypothetical protein